MRISTLDISGITTAVRRHEALLRYARYLLIFDLVIFFWEGIPLLSQVTSFQGLLELVASPAWKWLVLVLGSVGATYLILAHRLWWAYAAIFLAQVGAFFTPSPDKQILRASVTLAYDVAIEPRMRPLGPLATELAIMTIGFSYIMMVYCLYSAAWTVSAGRVPRAAYGRRLSPLEPLRPSRLLDTLLPGHRSQTVTLWEAALFALSSVLFVAASTAPFYGFRRVQNGFLAFASQVQQACIREGLPAQSAEATMACWAGYYPWSRTAIDLGAPVIVAAACLVLANRLRHLGRQHFVRRLADLKISPAGSTLFLRAFRDDQMRIRRASRNLFSSVFDLGRMPGTLDELMLERLDGHGDLIAIGNPQDRKGAARQSPWGAQRLYVDDAHWRETVTMLGRDADRIVLCVDASDGVRWEIAHVLRNGHTSKTLFFLNPSIDAQTRTRLLMEDFSVCAADLASVDVDRILALRATSPEQLLLMFCARPERDAYLVAARLAFEDTVADAASESAGALAADNERTVLAPKDRLRVGAYPGSPLSMLQETSTGETHGLSIDLGKELAKRLGVPCEQVNYQRIADVLEGMKAGDVDFTISNATPARALDVAFSQTLLSLELGYLVPAAAAIATAFDLDKPGIRVGVTQGSTSERTLPKMLAQAAVVPAQNVNDAIRMLARGELDAFATNKPTLFEMSDAMPGARILGGRWGVEHVAVAIPKGRDSAMEYVRRFVEDVQSSGLLAQAIERAGLRGAVEAE